MQERTDGDDIIVCERVAVAYGRQEVLRDVNLRIPAGHLLPFVGPNGAGKTTLLRAILGLLPLRRGRIRTPFAHRPAGYVPQIRAIDPLFPVSARRIVEMGLYPELGPWRRPTAEQRGRVDRVLERFRLHEHQRKTFGELSGGMKQKALLARAMVSRAEVFILDEPTSELDDESEREVLDELGRLCREEGRTVLLAYHGLEKAASLSPLLCRVNHGEAQLIRSSAPAGTAGGGAA